MLLVLLMQMYCMTVHEVAMHCSYFLLYLQASGGDYSLLTGSYMADLHDHNTYWGTYQSQVTLLVLTAM